MKTTDELLKALKNYKSPSDYLDDYYEDINNLTFGEYLNECMKSCNMTRSEVIDNANIQKNYGYQIFNGTKKPSRDKVLAICFSLRLSLDETNRLLKLSDHSILYPRIKRDSIIIFAIEKNQSLMDTNLLLDALGEMCIES